MNNVTMPIRKILMDAIQHVGLKTVGRVILNHRYAIRYVEMDMCLAWRYEKSWNNQSSHVTMVIHSMVMDVTLLVT